MLDVFFVCLALWLMSRSEETAETRRDAQNEKYFSARLCDLRGYVVACLVGLTMGGLALTRENALVFIVVILGVDRREAPNAERRAPN